MSNDSTPFLIGPWKETRNILKGQDRDVERITESNKSCRFVTRIDIETSCENLRLVGNNADGMAR